MQRPFKVLGIQQIAIGGPDKTRLQKLWVDMLGLEVTGTLRAMDRRGHPPWAWGCQCRVDSAAARPEETRRAHHAAEPRRPVDRRSAQAVAWLTAQGVRFAPGGITGSASEIPIAGEGVLTSWYRHIEVVSVSTDRAPERLESPEGLVPLACIDQRSPVVRRPPVSFWR
jgi:lactoylglutathione lyase